MQGSNIHAWAANIVNQAFQQVMGRAPTPAERQIVMAVSSLESGYGRGWGKGKSNAGQGSHNWGAVQTRSKTAPQFQHGDSSAEGSYTVGFKVYPDDVAGAADVVRHLFKSGRKQQKPSAKHKQRAQGGEISGPGRGELIQAAAEQGDTTAFSRAMWYTSYFEGTQPDFVKNIQNHANGIQSKVNKIAAALGETPAWSIKTQNYLPVTTDQSVISEIAQMNPEAGAGMPVAMPAAPQQPLPSPAVNVRPALEEQPASELSGIESMVWFQ